MEATGKVLARWKMIMRGNTMQTSEDETYAGLVS